MPFLSVVELLLEVGDLLLDVGDFLLDVVVVRARDARDGEQERGEKDERRPAAGTE